MTQKIFTIYDSKVEAYMNPIFCRSKGEAIRSLTDAVNDEKTQINKYPEDFTLFEIGEFDPVNGTITVLDAKKSLGLALEYKRQG